MSVAVRGGANETVLVRFGSSAKVTLFHLDIALITLWFAVTVAKFSNQAMLLYPLALYFTYAFLRDWHRTWPMLRHAFILMLVPFWWLLSASWSPETALATRSGVQAILTIVICCFAASRLNTRQMLLVIFIALTAALLRSFPTALSQMSAGIEARGIYAHKNPFGIDMAILAVVSIAVALISELPRWLRFGALGVVPMAFLMIFATKSATAILLGLGMCGMLIGIMLYVGKTNIFTLARLFLISVTVGLVLAGLAVAINLTSMNVVDVVLEALGKDRGLTGRTYLWTIAQNEITERPLFGTGAVGYWRHDESPFVRQIYIDFYKEPWHGFHFHNSWLEIAVNLGLIGMGLAIVSVTWAFFVLLGRALTHGGVENWTYLSILVAILLRTMTESDLFRPFVMLHMMLWTACLAPMVPTAARRLRVSARSVTPAFRAASGRPP